VHRHRRLHRAPRGKRIEPDDEEEDERDPYPPIPAYLLEEHPKQEPEELSDFEAMAILYAAGQQITTVDALSLREIHFAAELVQLGQLIRRNDDLKAQISAFRR
jgi:hypothetical protein